jgi:hypothetical protein
MKNNQPVAARPGQRYAAISRGRWPFITACDQTFSRLTNARAIPSGDEWAAASDWPDVVEAQDESTSAAVTAAILALTRIIVDDFMQALRPVNANECAPRESGNAGDSALVTLSGSPVVWGAWS